MKDGQLFESRYLHTISSRGYAVNAVNSAPYAEGRSNMRLR